MSKYISLFLKGKKFFSHTQKTVWVLLGLLLCCMPFSTMAQQVFKPAHLSSNRIPLQTKQVKQAGKLFPSQQKTQKCSRHSAIYHSFFKNQSSYIPENGLITPATVVKKIKIRFVVLENNNQGKVQRNFRPSDVQDLYQMVDWLNEMMSRLAKPTEPVAQICGACYIKNERIQVILTGVDFINDTMKYIYPKNANLVTRHGKYKDSILNIYLYVDSSRMHQRGQITYFTPGAWAGIDRMLSGPENSPILDIKMFNTYLSSKTLPEVNPGSTYYGTLRAETLRLMHELHHCLGLGHLQKDKKGARGFDPGKCNGPEFLVDAFPNGCPMSYQDKKNNNIMNMSGSWSNYLSPLQIGRINRNAFLGVVSKYAYPTEDPNIHPWTISKSQLWDFPIRMFQNIIIPAGTTLIISCTVQMPPKAYIYVQPGGTLIIDGGKITAYSVRSFWGGIRSEKSGINNASNVVTPGQIILKNGGIIENAIN